MRTVRIDSANVNCAFRFLPRFAKNPVMHFLLRGFALIIGTTQPPADLAETTVRRAGKVREKWKMIPERRSCVRHKVHGPVFASFDGVTGGMILDLSEQGISMQTIEPLEAERRVQLRLDLPDSGAQLETTGYIAWADALGRAGVRFSDLPVEARQRLDEWLLLNEKAPSRKAPKLTFERMLGASVGSKLSGKDNKPRSVSLEGIGLEGDPTG